ncbi:MAG: glycosyltransferase family 2 protein [Verrucomicrobia bacterium]|nr:glycosyltransferase family 2 protein [Verrucomicrobiota bacterium]MBI3867215.1 glycosyltransferase family 2 protein [Verrucomicrobiota bacterium]
MRISFCLITLNEEANLRRCLESCAELADEMVILDSGSVDRTPDIAAEFGARFERQDWLGFVGQKNAVLSRARNDWVFSIDADEELSPQLRSEVRALRDRAAEPEVDAFSMPRCVLYEGRWIRHGDWYPDRLVRLFRKSRARFEGGKVHERLECDGAVEPLRGELRHYSFRDAADHWARCQKYARLWAESQSESGRGASALSPYGHALFRWLRGWILRRGFMDGRQGLQIANYCAREVFLKYQLLRELNRGHPRRGAG